MTCNVIANIFLKVMVDVLADQQLVLQELVELVAVEAQQQVCVHDILIEPFLLKLIRSCK